jgi:hypothetical protein
MRGVSGGCRIGNRRSRCTTCNRFAQHVMRETRKQLIELHEEEYMALRLEAERSLYPVVLAEFTEAARAAGVL